MRDFLSHEPWKKILPASFNWLESVSVKQVSTLAKDSACVVLAAQDGTIDAPKLEDSVKTSIAAHAKKVSWTAKSGNLCLDVHGQIFLIVPLSTVAVSAKRKGRQAGLDVAGLLLKYTFPALTLCQGKETDVLDIFEGMAQGVYQLASFKSKDETAPLPKSVSLLADNLTPTQINTALVFARTQQISRTLADAPANWLTPMKFSEVAQSFAQDFKLKCTIKGREEIQALGMGSFFSVAKGSPLEPQLIVVEVPGKDTSKTIALVGKGLTFDTGGTSLKPSLNLSDMKYDMCGGAVVLTSAYYFAQVPPPCNVVCIVGAVENISGGWATRPGDIVKSMNGKTIEILDTDAEGRLVLADLLHYANQTYKPEFMINAATLTGAVVIALGGMGSALMTNNQKLGDYVAKVAQNAGEPFWQLPMWPELTKEVKSDIADLKNIPGASIKSRALIAGVFLQEFVGTTPWVHLDIAGTAWGCQATGYPSSGASAFGLRTLVGACEQMHELHL